MEGSLSSGKEGSVSSVLATRAQDLSSVSSTHVKELDLVLCLKFQDWGGRDR